MTDMTAATASIKLRTKAESHKQAARDSIATAYKAFQHDAAGEAVGAALYALGRAVRAAQDTYADNVDADYRAYMDARALMDAGAYKDARDPKVRKNRRV